MPAQVRAEAKRGAASQSAGAALATTPRRALAAWLGELDWTPEDDRLFPPAARAAARAGARSAARKVIKNLDIPDRLGKVSFNEVLGALAAQGQAPAPPPS